MFYRVRISLVFLFATLLTVACTHDISERLASADSQMSDTLAVALPESLYFWEHAAPIFHTHCTPCHYDKGAAPFALISFTDVKKRSKTIRWAVADRFMPPWPADPTYRHFKDEKTLSHIERETILRWIDKGALEGKKPDMLPKPLIHDNSGLGKPDMIIKFPDEVSIKGDNLDRFRIAKIPFELPRDTIIRAIAFVPGNRQLVHHVNGNLLNYEPAKKKDTLLGEWILDAERIRSLNAYTLLNLSNDDGTYPPLLASAFNYLPGVEATAYPNGLGSVHFSKQGTFLLNTLHYGPSPVDTTDRSEIHIYYASERPQRPLKELQMGTLGITPIEPKFILPAGKISKFKTRYTLPSDISVLTINPHMHLLGTEFIAYAVSPERHDTIPLIHIPVWDFRWQYFYTFTHLLKIPAGYELIAVATFDNTSDNLLNPNAPPKTIFPSGENMKTTDEMFQFFITYVPYKTGDELIKL